MIVLGVPMYNFGVPAQLKNWIDAISRAQVTFRYTANGPEGLLKGKKVYVALTRGGKYRKVASKMGISSLQSYRGAQVFEALGLRQDVIDEYFSWTASRVGGIGTDVIAQEVLLRHNAAFPDRPTADRHTLPVGGQYQWRAEGEYHLFNPESIHRLQKAVRTGSYETFKAYSALINDQATDLATLRGLLEFKSAEADPARARSSRSRPSCSASRPARCRTARSARKRTRRSAIAMNRIGGKSNTGEGGEDPERLRAAAERRLEEQRDQAGRVRPLWRDERVPGQREGNADQDGAGRQAGRGRPAARQQGVSVDRQDAALHAGRRADFAAAASRHLFDRGSGAS